MAFIIIWRRYKTASSRGPGTDYTCERLVPIGEEDCLKIYRTTDVKPTPHWDLRRHAVALQASFVPNPEAF